MAVTEFSSSDLHAQTDEALVQQFLSGNRVALDALMRRYWTSCIRIAQTTIRNDADAEEEVQNAWCRVWQHLAQCQDPRHFSSWLFRIVVNQCLMRIRKERSRRGEPLDDHSSHMANGQLSPEAILSKQQIQHCIRREVRLLPPLLRDPLVLSELEDRPLKEVALQLGISLPAAKSRVLRARVEMRRRILEGRERGTLPI